MTKKKERKKRSKKLETKKNLSSLEICLDFLLRSFDGSRQGFLKLIALIDSVLAGISFDSSVIKWT